MKPCTVIAILILTILSPLGTIAAGSLWSIWIFRSLVPSIPATWRDPSCLRWPIRFPSGEFLAEPLSRLPTRNGAPEGRT
jgi:hypothetical protein